MNRAYGLIEIKAIDDDARVIEGVATHVSPDRLGDVVEPRGAQFSLPVPLLWQHGKGQPAIGNVTRAHVTDEGIFVRAELARDDEPGPLKDLLDLAWRSIKKGLVRGLSIGFRPLSDPEPIKGTGGWRFKTWELLELSTVTIPAHQAASISVIKSLASPDASHTPGMTGTRFQGSPMKTYSEQIQASEQTRKTKSDEMGALMTAAGEKGETLNGDDAEKYETLKTEVKDLDAHLVRLREMDEVNKFTYTPAQGTTAQAASDARGGSATQATTIQVRDNLPPGISFARAAMAKVCSYLDHVPAREVAAERWPNDTRLKNYFAKAATPAGTTTLAVWAGNLVYADNLASEFVEFLRPQTLVGRLPLRRVPFNIRFASQTTGAVANWVGEGRGKPVTSFQTGTGSLGYTKIAAISVITQELARFSSPSAEQLVRDELARAVIERLDIDFIDPAQAVSAGVNPASITNGLTALSSAGTSAANVITDLQNLLENFLQANMNTGNVVLIMPNTLAMVLSLMQNAFGQTQFPGIGINGGTLQGIPVFTTQYAANQSGAGNLVIALDPTAILLADDGQVDISVSTEASIEMSDAPTNRSDTPTAASLVSLWQTNSIGIKAERFVNWTKARSTAVVYMDDVNWGSIGSPS